MNTLPTIIVGSFDEAPPADGRVYLCLKSRRIWRDGRSGSAGYRRFRVLFALACGAELSHHDVFNVCWGDSHDGGPLDTDSAVSNIIWHARRACREVGLDVKNRWGFGFTLIAQEAAAA